MRKIFVLSLLLLSGCAADKAIINDVSQEQSSSDNKSHADQQGLKERQKLVAQKYQEAIAKHHENMKPIAKYIITVCRPKDDKAYIICLNEKKDEMIAISLFPDLEIKMFNAINKLEQQLAGKKITRGEFMAQLQKLGRDTSNQVHERATNDIKAGIYTGKI